MLRILFLSTIALCLVPLLPRTLDGQVPRGTPASLDRQNEQAELHGFTTLESPAHVRRFVDAGLLVELVPNRDYELHRVSFPFVRPEVRLFVERLSAQYRTACGERLVVTSATRPVSTQPPNASPRSVHPTGMAIDLRVPQNPTCRNWLERVLVQLKNEGVMEVIREFRPPHYHLAIFPSPYAAYVETRLARGEVAPSSPGPAGPAVRTVAVSRGDSLWSIARRHGSTVEEIASLNGLTSPTIHPGMSLRVPAEH